VDTTPSHPGAQGPSASGTDPQATAAGAPTSAPPAEEGLPEFEPLTPELVEDEAIRGDFMLRWSAILLATLLGWTEITESLTLVRIKTGQYLASHGILPPATDVFSVSAEKQPWINLSWLGDLVLAGVYGVGGDLALTALGALLAGISFYCVLAAARTGTSTWWNSICATLAAVAAFPLLRPGPDSITILGLALTMLILTRSEERPDSARYVLLIPLMWLWSNLDGHAFLGAAVVLAYAIGDMLDARRSGFNTSGKSWMFAIGGVLAMFVHPFHVAVARAPQLLLQVDARERLAYAGDGTEFGFMSLNLLDRTAWQPLSIFALAGVLTGFAAFLSLVLNRKHVRLSHVLVWLALSALAVVSIHALLAISVVFAVIGGINGQEWYRRGFRQTYSVETSELAFSRGGRAVTVVGLFALAYLAASGRLMGEDGRRIGSGFDADIRNNISSFDDLLADSFDDRSFNFNPAQGDVLIWVGHKPFIDSRFGMYASAQPNLCELHRKLRLALRQRVSGDDRTGQRSLWHSAFEEYAISHTLPRLSGQRPNYETFFDLLTDPEREWRLAKIGAASAALYWNRPDDVKLAEFLAAHPGADFLKLAFPRDAKEDPPPLPMIPPPRAPSWYDRLLILPKSSIPNDIQLARHFTQIRIMLSNRIALDDATALIMLGIRHARRGLVNEPNSADAYQALSACYLGLGEMERLLDPSGGSLTGALRARQALSSLYHAAKCNPDDATTQMTLFQVLYSGGKTDLAVLHLQEVDRINGALTLTNDNSEQAKKEDETNRKSLADLVKRIDDARKELRLSLASDTSRLEVVQSALNRGLPGEALKLLEEDQTVVAQNSTVQFLMADLLLDAGRIEDAVNLLESMAGVMLQQSPAVTTRWRSATAVANIAAGNYERARTLLEDDAKAATEMRLQSTLGMSPAPGQVPSLSTAPFAHGTEDLLDARSLTRATILTDLLYSFPQQWGRDQFLLATCDLEDGRNLAALARFQQLLERDPESELRGIVAFYDSAMTGRIPQLFTPSQEIPIWNDLIAQDPAAPEAAAAPQPDAQPATPAAPAAAEPANSAEPPAPAASERKADTPAP